MRWEAVLILFQNPANVSEILAVRSRETVSEVSNPPDWARATKSNSCALHRRQFATRNKRTEAIAFRDGKQKMGRMIGTVVDGDLRRAGFACGAGAGP